jgi:hypothetical protein
MAIGEYSPPTALEMAEAWRLEQLLLAGYELEHAEQLAARRDVDLHQAIELVERGCAPAIAASILL